MIFLFLIFSWAAFAIEFDELSNSSARVARRGRGKDDSFTLFKDNACRKRYGQEGKKNKDYILFDNISPQECKANCLDFEKCFGWEYTSSSKTCMAWNKSHIFEQDTVKKAMTDCYINHNYYAHDDDNDDYVNTVIIPTYGNLKSWCMDQCKQLDHRRRYKRHCLRGCRRKYDPPNNILN